MTRASEPISVEGMDRMGMLIPIAMPISLMACSDVNPAAIRRAGRSREIAELMSEPEVRIPVIGSADARRGRSWPRGSRSFPPLIKK